MSILKIIYIPDYLKSYSLCSIGCPQSPQNFTLIVVLSIIGNLILLVIIMVFSYYFANKARGFIVNYLPTMVNTTSNNRTQNQVLVSEVDAPTWRRSYKREACRFTTQRLYTFTQNYLTRLGLGGFVVVYKGQFPNRVKIAMKVLNKNSDRAAEEEFMAEVATIERTYNLNSC